MTRRQVLLDLLRVVAEGRGNDVDKFFRSLVPMWLLSRSPIADSVRLHALAAHKHEHAVGLIDVH